jgi:hypothetical protein
MSKQALRCLTLLSAIMLIIVLTVGCSSGEQRASGPNSVSDSPAGTIQPSDAPAAGVTASPAPAESSIDSAATQKPAVSAAPAGEPSPATVSPKVTAEASAESGVTSGGSTPTGAPVKTPAPAQSPSKATSKPSPAVKPAGPTAAPVKESVEKANTVTISITGDAETGMILAPAAVEIKSGDSVLEITKRITRKLRIQMEFQGAGAAAYVEGIDNLYALDKGAESGWMFRVNGEFPDKSAGSYTLVSGDRIEWLYTLDLGKDIGAKRP